MCLFPYDDDPDPEERAPAGLLHVPVRPGAAGPALRMFRTPLGERTAVGFTRQDLLTATLGAGQSSIRLVRARAPFPRGSSRRRPTRPRPRPFGPRRHRGAGAHGRTARPRAVTHASTPALPRRCRHVRSRSHRAFGRTGRSVRLARLHRPAPGRRPRPSAGSRSPRSPSGSAPPSTSWTRARCAHAAAPTGPPSPTPTSSTPPRRSCAGRWSAGSHEEGLGLDVCSAGELATRRHRRLPARADRAARQRQEPEDLERALRLGVGRIVVDSPSEIARLAARSAPAAPAEGHGPGRARASPPAATTTIRTGTEDQKFGLSLADGSAQHAIARVLGQPQLELAGLHCHIGSQITAVKPYLAAVRRMVGLMARIRDQHGVVLPELDLGGGHGVAYRPGETALDLDGARRAASAAELAASCARSRAARAAAHHRAGPGGRRPGRGGALPRARRQAHRRADRSSPSTAA